jgi:hypothetical protein
MPIESVMLVTARSAERSCRPGRGESGALSASFSGELPELHGDRRADGRWP